MRCGWCVDECERRCFKVTSYNIYKLQSLAHRVKAAEHVQHLDGGVEESQQVEVVAPVASRLLNCNL